MDLVKRQKQFAEKQAAEAAAQEKEKPKEPLTAFLDDDHVVVVGDQADRLVKELGAWVKDQGDDLRDKPYQVGSADTALTIKASKVDGNSQITMTTRKWNAANSCLAERGINTILLDAREK